MKLLSLFFVIIVTAASSKAYLTKKEFNALSSEQRDSLISAYRLALNEFNLAQDKNEIIYEQPGRSSDTAAVLKILFLPLAISEWNEGPKCIFAGHISKIYKNASNKSVCQFPRGAEKGCRPGQMRCNPVFYGETSCVAINNNATAACDQTLASGSSDNLTSNNSLTDLANLWIKNQQAVLDSCKNPDIQLPQKSICANLIAKVERIKKSEQQ